MNLAQKFKIPIPNRLDENHHVIVADGQQDMRMIVVHQLRKLNFKNVIQANTGVQALEHLKTCDNVSSMIVSAELEDMTGLELLTEIKEDTSIPRPPFCLAIANVSKEKLMLAVETGVDEILVKPFTLADIVPKLRNAFKVFHNPNNPEKVYELAKQALKRQELDMAIKIYQELQDAGDKRARPVVGMAKAYFLKNEHDKALQLLQTAEKNNPHYIHIYPLRAAIMQHRKDLKEAVRWHLRAIELSPLNPVRYPQAAEILFEMKDYEQLINLLEEAFNKKVSYHILYYYVSRAYLSLQDAKKSLKYGLKTLEKAGENQEYLLHLANVYETLEEYKEANKCLSQVLKLNPDHWQALLKKAFLFEKTQNFKEALRLFERVSNLQPDCEEAIVKIEELKKQLQSSGN